MTRASGRAPARDYFVDKARDVFRRAGGDPDNAGPLAEWAEQVHPTHDMRLGVIVARDGRIVAETRHTPSTASTSGGTYVTSETPGVTGREVGMAIGILGAQLGTDLIQVSYSDVCRGAAVNPPTAR